MKKVLFFLVLAFAGTVNAQIVNIPDANFKNYLLGTGALQPASEPIDTNLDGEIQVSEALAIEEMEIFEHPTLTGPFTTVQGIEAFTNLTDLSVWSDVTNLNLSGLSQLAVLELQCDLLTELNLDGLISLQKLSIEFTQLTSFDVSALPSLERIEFSSCNFMTSFTGVSSTVKYMWLDSESLEELDLSGCQNLQTLNVTLNSENHDVFVNLKNGSFSNSTAIYVDDNEAPYKCFICVDEGELEYLNYIDQDALVSTYCTFTPGGDYNVITGSLLFDDEGDGCDPDDTVISNIKLNINDGTETGSTISSTGLYNFYTHAGTFTVTPDFDNDMFTISPLFAEVNFTAVDSLVTTQNFCLTPNGNHPDLDIVIVPYGAQPGFDALYKVVYRNKGNQMLSGSVVLNYQEDILDIVMSNPSQDSSSSGALTWNYTGLAPFQQREIYVIFNVNGPMETPPVNIDDLLGFTALITPSVGDDTPDDNTFGLNQIVVGSLDPNDITCLEGTRIHPDRIGEYLHYNINFENTGTAPATFIVVEDVIDQTQFDISSLQLINASHEMQASITGNKVVFRFDEINLGPQEKGNVTFKIKTLNTLQANDDVTQQANIFFDYNWPIETNEATTVFEVLSRGDFEMDNSVKIYPNPSNGMVNISAASGIRSVELYDIQGRLLQAGDSSTLDISGRATGMYFLKIFSEAGTKVEKIIKE